MTNAFGGSAEAGAGETVPLYSRLRPENLTNSRGGSHFRQQTADRTSLALPPGRKRELVSEHPGKSQQPGRAPAPRLCSPLWAPLTPPGHSPQPLTFLFGLASSSLCTNSSLLHSTKPFLSSAPLQELSPARVHQDVLRESPELAAATFSLPICPLFPLQRGFRKFNETACL